ncbi:MAG: competence/damage-inducible protein A [Lutibacter sp.]|uniref:competence/damage-inducible protein A n=1 Tax=Lutibacter sp. TaxID=1925666 RepID=UPI001831F1A4|nr:competence/damage-inducible protein A [Lutibacter sp.]MBT8317086.1 competence/damage-inducible protein A [Lutibacter sp.]NNJ57946.1 competence/damage-inducible protein A [Lutibacter sp.]
MQAEIITIGDEILIGQILDSNSKWIAEELNKIGVSVYQITSIQDEKQHILKAIKEAQSNADIVIITGGLGPTKDDITKLTLAEYFNDILILDDEVVLHIESLFKKMNYPFTEVNRQQALVPSTCTPLKNYFGTAPGMWFDCNKKVVISLPGVPYEMKGLIENSVLPKLKETFELPYILHKTVLTYGMGESMVAARIENWENNLPKFIKLAYLPSYGKVRLRLTAKGDNEQQLNQGIAEEVEKLTVLIPDIIVGFDESETVEVVLGKMLSEKGQTLSTAESCTGGNIAKLITSIPGSSDYFVGSVVAYHPEIKINELGVDKDLIVKHSVVSAEVTEAMAKGIQGKFKTTYAIATTGNAGPSTDNTDESVGTVYIAIASPTTIFSKKYFFGQPREKVIQKTSYEAIELLKKEILKN